MSVFLQGNNMTLTNIHTEMNTSSTQHVMTLALFFRRYCRGIVKQVKGIRPIWAVYCCTFFLVACTSTPAPNGKVETASLSSKELVQSDVNRMATIAMADNLEALSQLASRLYDHNPSQLKKSGLDKNAAIARLNNAIKSRTPWKNLGEKRALDAVALSLSPGFKGDRVAAFVYAASDIFIQAQGDRVEFYLLNGLDAQKLYNAARDVDKASQWLTTKNNPKIYALAMSNEDAKYYDKVFGKIIGRLDTLEEFVTEKYRRAGVGYIQGLVGGSLFQFFPAF